MNWFRIILYTVSAALGIVGRVKPEWSGVSDLVAVGAAGLATRTPGDGGKANGSAN